MTSPDFNIYLAGTNPAASVIGIATKPTVTGTFVLVDAVLHLNSNLEVRHFTTVLDWAKIVLNLATP